MPSAARAHLRRARRRRRAASSTTRSSACIAPDAMLQPARRWRGCSPTRSQRGERLLIVADYDADGATACAVGMRALRAFGADVEYLVPNRFEYGYGLTPEIVRLAHERKPARRADHRRQRHREHRRRRRSEPPRHAGADHRPPPARRRAARTRGASSIPNQPGCGFPSKHLAGVGVMFYLMLALRAELRARGASASASRTWRRCSISSRSAPSPTWCGSTRNNRVLVQQGLKRIRAGRMQPGIAALLRGRGPRPRARVRLRPGLRARAAPERRRPARPTCRSASNASITDDPARAERDRARARSRSTASAARSKPTCRKRRSPRSTPIPAKACTLCLFDAGWHQGVVGIVASRLKERFHRPVIAFARGSDGEIKGSGRSIPGLHLRDALDLVAKRHPGLDAASFGGHAAAAGLTLRERDFERLRAAFEDDGARARSRRRSRARRSRPTARSTPRRRDARHRRARSREASGARAFPSRASSTRSTWSSSASSADGTRSCGSRARGALFDGDALRRRASRCRRASTRSIGSA